ncbi:MAG: hypothetical protein V1701_11485 [Planctomycetota bacterium]
MRNNKKRIFTILFVISLLGIVLITASHREIHGLNDNDADNHSNSCSLCELSCHSMAPKINNSFILPAIIRTISNIDQIFSPQKPGKSIFHPPNLSA